MYLRSVTYQLGVRLKSLVPCFHKSHLENLVLLVVGIAYARSVSLPKAAGAVPYNRIQLESRVERFERLLQCEKLEPLSALKPTAKKVLWELSRGGRVHLKVVMDRSMINDTLNLLFLAVTYEGRALPLGWVRVPHEGNSNLRLQQQLLRWFKACLPLGATATVVADREFHSIHLAAWIVQKLGFRFRPPGQGWDLGRGSGHMVQGGRVGAPGMHLQLAGGQGDARPEGELSRAPGGDLGWCRGRAVAVDHQSYRPGARARDLCRALLDRRDVF